MKKLLVLVLSLAMVLSLSACGNKETKKSDSDSSKKNGNQLRDQGSDQIHSQWSKEDLAFNTVQFNNRD